MRVLVTGGAGYIGSVVAAQLVAAGHEVTVLDDLSTGFADAVPPGATFVKGTLRDCAAEILTDDIEAVLHFAAKSLVGESVADPAKYWSNNLGGTVALLEAMREMRSPHDRLLLDRRGLRRARAHAHHRDRSHPPDQPLRRVQARRRHHLDRVQPAVRVRRGQPALLQRGRRAAGRRRRLARRAAQPGDPPHPQRAGRRDRGAPGADLRRRLPHPRRDLRPRLHPRHRPGRRAPARAGRPAGPASTASTTSATGPASRSAR